MNTIIRTELNLGEQIEPVCNNAQTVKLFLGNVCGIRLTTRGQNDPHICFQFLVEDDGFWFVSNNSISTVYLREIGELYKSAICFLNDDKNIIQNSLNGWEVKQETVEDINKHPDNDSMTEPDPEPKKLPTLQEYIREHGWPEWANRAMVRDSGAGMWFNKPVVLNNGVFDATSWTGRGAYIEDVDLDATNWQNSLVEKCNKCNGTGTEIFHDCRNTDVHECECRVCNGMKSVPVKMLPNAIEHKETNDIPAVVKIAPYTVGCAVCDNGVDDNGEVCSCCDGKGEFEPSNKEKPKTVTCKACNGSGDVPTGDVTICHACNGDGVVLLKETV